MIRMKKKNRKNWMKKNRKDEQKERREEMRIRRVEIGGIGKIVKCGI